MISEKILFHADNFPINTYNGDILFNNYENTITTFLLSAILGLLALLFVLHRKHIILILQSLFSQRIFSQLVRDAKLIKERISFLLNFINSLIFIFFIYSLIIYFFPHFRQLWSVNIGYIVALLVILINFILKRGIFSVYTYLFDLNENKEDFSLHKLSYSTINSFLLFPILIITFYTKIPQILLVYIPIFIVTFFTLFYRLYSLYKIRGNKFQFFLYFCTIEIIPYIIFLKIAFILGK